MYSLLIIPSKLENQRIQICLTISHAHSNVISRQTGEAKSQCNTDLGYLVHLGPTLTYPSQYLDPCYAWLSYTRQVFMSTCTPLFFPTHRT